MRADLSVTVSDFVSYRSPSDDVAYWHDPDMRPRSPHVRYWGHSSISPFDPLTDVEALLRRFDLPHDRCFGNGVTFCFN